MPIPEKKPDKREYTIMVVPHHGQSVRSIRIPISAIKCGVGILSVAALILGGMFINYRHTVHTANAEKAELEKLRQVNNFQVKQIEQLAKATSVLQEDMARLNKLDAEVRRMLNNEETGVSRSGSARPGSNASGGQGGPTAPPKVDELLALVNDLQANAKAREQSLKNLRDALSERNARLAATPSIWPASGEVTSRFGWRSSPWGWGSDWHPGIDIANDYGTPIAATAAGEVVFSGWYGGYGQMIRIDHGNGIETVYAHNAENLVRPGQYVKKGDVIAYMGSTGASTGTHLHYEVRVNGTAVNPANFL
ncbi:MAG: M23 family metallopeptidase [Negativicutes bacterium]|nr:M23 family metallopeptidase [Negativicutes bacterium]